MEHATTTDEAELTQYLQQFTANHKGFDMQRILQTVQGLIEREHTKQSSKLAAYEAFSNMELLESDIDPVEAVRVLRTRKSEQLKKEHSND